jgi:hypothetical protein
MFGGPRLVRRPLGIIHVTDVLCRFFGLAAANSWLSRASAYLGTHDEKSELSNNDPAKTTFGLVGCTRSDQPQ